LEKEKELALAEAARKHQGDLAKREAELEKQRQLELAKAEQALKEQGEQEAERLKKEKERALAEAAKKHQGDLDAQKAALEKEKAKALANKEQAFADKLAQQKELLAKVADELTPYVEALEAKNKIVEGLNETFKDFDPSAVEIDKGSGKVKLHFEESYFARGSHKLSEDMKRFLRAVIPKYAKAIYGNKEAADHVQSLKISGMTSPVYAGVYVDINDKSPETEKARKYNMDLSNRRAKALYNFIFDKDEMGDFEYRDRLKADMIIEALGFQKATPVKPELVGKPAKCIEYDCKQERVTILQFNVFSEE
jgi:flagellar motor protein MotB